MKDDGKLYVEFNKEIHIQFSNDLDNALLNHDIHSLRKLMGNKLIRDEHYQKIAAWYLGFVNFDPKILIENAIDRNDVILIKALLNSFELGLIETLRKKQDKLKLHNESLLAECKIIEKQISFLNQNKTFEELKENLNGIKEEVINQVVSSFFSYYAELDRNEFYIEGKHYHLKNSIEKEKSAIHLKEYFVKTTNKYNLKLKSSHREGITERWKVFLNSSLADLEQEIQVNAERLEKISMIINQHDADYSYNYEQRMQLIQETVLGMLIPVDDYLNHEESMAWLAEAIAHKTEGFNAKGYDRREKSYIHRAIEKSSAAVSVVLLQMVKEYSLQRQKCEESYYPLQEESVLNDEIQDELNKIPLAVLTDDKGNSFIQQLIMQCSYDENARILIYQIIDSYPGVLRYSNPDGLSALSVRNPNGETLLSLTISDVVNSLSEVSSKKQIHNQIDSQCFLRWMWKWIKKDANLLQANNYGLTSFDRLYLLLPLSIGDYVRSILQRRLIREINGKVICLHRYSNNGMEMNEWQAFPLAMLNQLAKYWKHLSECLKNLSSENANEFLPQRQKTQNPPSNFFRRPRDLVCKGHRNREINSESLVKQANQIIRVQQSKIESAIKKVIEKHIDGYDDGLRADMLRLIDDLTMFLDQKTREFSKDFKRIIEDHENNKTNSDEMDETFHSGSSSMSESSSEDENNYFTEYRF